MLPGSCVQIGRWQLHDDARVSSGRESNRLTPKAFDLLTFLVERPNRLVSNDEIVGALWAHEYVADASVYKLVSELRRALGDNSRAPAYIKNVPRRGYMLVAEVIEQSAPTSVDGNPSAARERWPAQVIGRAVQCASPAAVDTPRIAVLPFANLSSDPDQEYFSEGISEDILDILSRNANLTVRARHSSFRFKADAIDLNEIVEQLDVTHLVSGSVRAQGSHIRVSARLTDVAANADVWSARYDRELTDIFAVQDEITEAIVDALGLHFSAPEPARRTTDLAAYDAYSAGRYHQKRFEMEEAVACFTRATELDPAYADAYARLAHVYAILAWLSPPGFDELSAREREFVAKALAQDPQQHLALGLEVNHLLAAQDAIDRIDALLRRYPNDPDLLRYYGYVLRRIGRMDLVTRIIERMVELDPLSPEFLSCRSWNHFSIGRIQKARADADRCEQLGMPVALLRAQIALLERDSATVRAQCARPESDWRAMSTWRVMFAALGAYLEGDQARVAAILAPLENQRETLPRYNQHLMALMRDNEEAAADHLEAAIERVEPFALYIIQGDAVSRTLFPNFYAGARYRALLEKLELDPASVARLSIPLLPFASPA